MTKVKKEGFEHGEGELHLDMNQALALPIGGYHEIRGKNQSIRDYYRSRFKCNYSSGQSY